MKIAVVSDTHVRKFKDLPKKLVMLMESADMVVHAGDFTSVDVLEEFERKYNLRAVFGNADDYRVKERLNETETFRTEGIRFGITHRGNFLNEFHDLGYMAKEMGVDVLIFGHTHRFVVEKMGDVILICPGSPTSPRLSASSCAMVNVEDGEMNVSFELVGEFACGADLRLKEMMK